MLELLALSMRLVATVDAPPPATAVAPDVAAAARVIARVWLRADGLDPRALAEAVAARIPDKQVLGVGAADGPAPALAALCAVEVGDGGVLRLEVTLSDGRVYRRRIAAPNVGRERAAARLIFNTLAAIEDETATPDRRDGVFVAPAAEAAAASPPANDRRPAAPPAISSHVPRDSHAGRAGPAAISSHVPRDSRDGRAGPAAISSHVPRDSHAGRAGPAAISSHVPRDSHAAPPGRAGDGPALGLGLELGSGFGLGAPAAGLGLAAGGGGARIELRRGGGLALGAAYRGQLRARGGLLLARHRGALLAGYVLRRGAFELAAAAGPTLETFQVTQDGARVNYTQSSPGSSLLFGGLARLGLGARLAGGGGLSLRVGGFVELAGSARASGRAAQVARQHAVDAPLFVIGGVEASVGAELELWFALRRPRAPVRSRPRPLRPGGPPA